MPNWLIVYGVGGCWTGYTDATVIQAPDRDTAWRLGLDIALKETAEEQRSVLQGYSFDVEIIEGDVRETRLYASRCKPGAKLLAELAFDALEGVHG